MREVEREVNREEYTYAYNDGVPSAHFCFARFCSFFQYHVVGVSKEPRENAQGGMDTGLKSGVGERGDSVQRDGQLLEMTETCTKPTNTGLPSSFS